MLKENLFGGFSTSGGVNTNSHAEPIGIENPLFKVKLVSADKSLEPKNTVYMPYTDKMAKVGDVIKGQEMGKEKGKTVMGRVSKIVEGSDDEITYFVIVDKAGNQLKIDPTSVKKVAMNGEDGMVKESYIKKFNDWERTF